MDPMETTSPGAPEQAAYPYVPPGAPPIMATPPGAPVEAARPYVPPGAPPIMTNQITLFPVPGTHMPLFEEPPEDKMLIDPKDILPPSDADPDAPSGMDTTLGGNRNRDIIINKKKNKTKKGRRKKHKTKKHKRKRDKIKKSKTRKNKIKKRKTRKDKNKNN